MKKIIFSILTLVTIGVHAQSENKEKESDTTRITLNKREIIIVEKEKKDTIDASDWSDKHDGRWDGIEFGPSILLNSSGGSSFPFDPQWENDPAKSFYWNINIFDHRFAIYKHFVGITTGFGVNFTQIGIRNRQILLENSDSLWVITDSIHQYQKNKLRATYLQIPLLLEFNSSKNEDKAFYLATGVIGGVRVGSALIQKIDKDKSKVKGDYALNPFKLDATVRMGYSDWGLFVNYALMPLFDTTKTATVYPFTFGVSFNF